MIRGLLKCHTLIVFVGLVVFISVLVTPRPGQTAEGALVEELQSISEGRRLVGDPSAPELIEFFGYDCGFCVQYANEAFPSVFRKLVRDGTMNYRIKHYPLSTDRDGKAVQAHNASECAAEQDRFWAMKLLLTEDWPVGSRWEKYAREANVPNLDQFQNCMKENRYVDLILSHREDWSGGVPAFRLKDESWSGYRGPSGQITKISQILGTSGSAGIVSGKDSDIEIGRDLIIEDSGISLPSQHTVQSTLRYHNKTDRDLHYHIYGIRDDGRSRLSGYGGIDSGGGTSKIQYTFETDNPQYEGDPNETESYQGIEFRVYDRSHDTLIASWEIQQEFRLTLSGPPEGDPDRPSDPDVNEFKNVWVELTDDTVAQVHFDYNYRSNHGDHVYASAYFREEGRQLSGWAYQPHELEPRVGSGTVQVTFRDWDPHELPRTTDGIKLQMYVGGEGGFYEEHVKLDVTWSGERSQFGRGESLDRSTGNTQGSRTYMPHDSNEGISDNIKSGNLTDTSLVNPNTPLTTIKLTPGDRRRAVSGFEPHTMESSMTRQLGDRRMVEISGGYQLMGQ